ncbi:lipopolysaccharide transport periplasmic protein LptA [Robbsia sp. KACC 23696]|uniref:lipopolysaccharide transport periplasmic protein LptA n=1 Tax=Robbsia sp. KACC 23696 TaxID=3149231 RepID=UPI00325B73D3
MKFSYQEPRRVARRITATWLTLVALLGGLATSAAHAEQADKNKPLVYSADHLSYDDLKQTTILTGNVELTKGTIIVRGDRAEIHQDPEGYSYATATSDKGLAYIRQKRDGVNEYFEGQGKRIDYDGKSDVSTLTGSAVARRLSGLTTPIDEVHGSVIRYDGQTGYYTAQSNGGTKTGTPGGRVRGMIAPSTTTPAAPSSPASTDDGDSSASTGNGAGDGSRGGVANAHSTRTQAVTDGTSGASGTAGASPLESAHQLETTP